MAMRCARCGHDARNDAIACERCGAPFADAAPAGEGERRTVTALFADIKGSMELIDGLDPEDARGIVDPAVAVMMEAVHRYDGWLAQAGGDGVFAVFGAPVAQEDHPQRALHAALRMQEGVGRWSTRLHRERGLGLAIRVGVNTGEVVVRAIPAHGGRGEYDPLGHSIGLAKRLEALAAPGSILVSDQTHALTDGFFRFRDLGPARVRGVGRPVGVYELVGPGPLRTRFDRSARRGLTRLVGRQDELETMRRVLDATRAGRGQVMALVGEPGVGKSRLVHELTTAVDDDWLVLEACATAHGTAHPYLPLVDLLARLFGVAAEDAAPTRRDKVAARIQALDPTLADVLPYLFALLEIDEQERPLAKMHAGIRRRRTVDAVTRLLRGESRVRPLLVVVEDVHWLDPETLAVLSALAGELPGAPMALVVTHRPEHARAWAGDCPTLELRLEPFGDDHAREMLLALLGADEALAGLRAAVLARSDGNPLFIEEIVQALREEGVVRADGEPALTRPLDEIRIPGTVHAVLASRIDHLPGDARRVLQTLAVIGREFSRALVCAVTRLPDEEVGRLLAHLRGAEFVREQPGPPALVYRFKHALTQEVVYGSILRDRRRALHEAVAHAMERVHASRLEDHLAALANHYRLSGNVTKAVEYLRRAGEQAARRSAHAEAERQLRAAMELCAAMPDGAERAARELDVQTALGAVLLAAHGYGTPDVLEAFTRARELCDVAGDTPARCAALRGLAGVFVEHARLGTARELSWQLRGIAERSDEPSLLLEAERLLGEIHFWLGQLAAARQHAARVRTLYRPSEHGANAFRFGEDPAVVAGGFLAWTLWLMGQPDQACAELGRVDELARRLSHPFTTAYALALGAVLLLLRGDAEGVEARGAELATVAGTQGFPEWAGWADVVRGAARARLGDCPDGIALMGRGVATVRDTGSTVASSMAAAWMAEACLRDGRPDAALAATDEGFAAVRQTGVRAWYPELMRCRAEALLARDGPGADVEQLLRRALYVANRMGARAHELRVATTLARLARRRGDHAAAAQPLRALCERFDEGHDTIDLVEARSLLASP